MENRDNVHAFFNTTKNYLHQSFGIRVRTDLVHELIGKPMNKTFLDIGCGNGAISGQYLAQNHITFVDLSENMIALVKQSIPDDLLNNANTRVGSFIDMEFENHFDYVFAIGLLAHVPSIAQTLARISEVLAPGGSAILQFSDYGHWLTRYNIGNSAHYGYTINKLAYVVMKQAIEDAGFQLNREIRFSLLLPGMGKLPQSLLYAYSSAVWKNRLLSCVATDYMWLLKKEA